MLQQNKQIQLPYDLKAEKTIIGALVSGNYDLNYVLNEIAEIDTFYVPEHRAITLAVIKISEINIIVNKLNVIAYLSTENSQKYNLVEYLGKIEDTTITENELGVLCHRVRDCSMVRKFIYDLSDYSQRLNNGDIDAIKFFQQTHTSLFRGLDIFMKPSLAGFDSCEILDHLPELSKAEGWYVPLIKCLQSRWKKDDEQLSDVHS